MSLNAANLQVHFIQQFFSLFICMPIECRTQFELSEKKLQHTRDLVIVSLNHI